MARRARLCRSNPGASRAQGTQGHPDAAPHDREARRTSAIGPSRPSADVARRRGRHRAEPGRLCGTIRSEEHTSELQSLMRISYAVFCLKQKRTNKEEETMTQEQMKKRKQDIKYKEVHRR